MEGRAGDWLFAVMAEEAVRVVLVAHGLDTALTIGSNEREATVTRTPCTYRGWTICKSPPCGSPCIMHKHLNKEHLLLTECIAHVRINGGWLRGSGVKCYNGQFCVLTGVSSDGTHVRKPISGCLLHLRFL